MRTAWLACLLVVGGCTGDVDEGSSGGGGTDAPGATTAHRFCVDETNRYRMMNGKPAVVHSAQLEATRTRAP